jgi:hypothetical protein
MFMQNSLELGGSFTLALVVTVGVGALAFVVIVGIRSALSPLVFRHRRTWAIGRDVRRCPEHSEQFRVVADWMARSEELSRKISLDSSISGSDASGHPDSRPSHRQGVTFHHQTL